MKNKNFIFVCLLFQLLFLCVTTEMLAQDASKRINEIKRNEAYLFEEATAATEKEARDMAVVKLAKILADYMEENNPEGAKKLDDFKDLAEGAEEIVTDRGSQKRVFLYYSKQDMDATAEEASQIGTSQNVPEQEVANNTTTKPMENIPKPTTKPEIVEEQPKATRPLTDYPNTNPSANKSVSDENLAEWQKRLIVS